MELVVSDVLPLPPVDSFYGKISCTVPGVYKNTFEVRGGDIDLDKDVEKPPKTELLRLVKGTNACTKLESIKGNFTHLDGDPSSELSGYSCKEDSYVLIRCYTP